MNIDQTAPPAPDLGPDAVLDAGVVLGRVAVARDAEESAARDKLFAAVDWAAIHSGDTIVGPANEWCEQALPLGGEGAPAVAEFAVVEFAAALGVSTQAGRGYLSDAVELRYRLPLLFARVKAGAVVVWRARRVAQATHCLPEDGARWVDRQVAEFAATVSFAQLERLVTHAKATFDPDAAEADRVAAQETRHVDIRIRDAAGNATGVVSMDAALDLLDALDLEAAVADGAAQQVRLGSMESVDVRRSRALGLLARTQMTLDLPADDTGDAHAVRIVAKEPAARRQLVVYAHLHADATQAAQTGQGTVDTGPFAAPSVPGVGFATIENSRCLVAVDQIAGWCSDPDLQVVIKPVIDLNGNVGAHGYAVPERLREHTTLRDGTCVFPYCNRDARRTDKDHIVPWDPDDPGGCGATEGENLGSLCRTHHRAKTTGGWTYSMPEPGWYLWRSRHGQHFLTHAGYTRRLSPPY